MPRRRPDRELGSEQRLVAAVRKIREQRGLTYEQLAQLMTDAGCKMHASGVQKTVEQGRRVTVDELIGYARAFDTTPESLLQYGGDREPRTQETWRDLLAAERFQEVMEAAGRAYADLIKGVWLEVGRNEELRRNIESRLEAHRRSAERAAREQAEFDEVDVSTPGKLDTYLWGESGCVDATMLTCRDALKEQQ